MLMPIIIPSDGSSSQGVSHETVMWSIAIVGWVVNVLAVIMYDTAFDFLSGLKRNGKLALLAVSLVPFLTAAVALGHSLYRWIFDSE